MGWLHCGEFREVGTATTAPENRGDKHGVACRCRGRTWLSLRCSIAYVYRRGEMANVFRMVGRTATIYKPTTAARLCAP